MGRLDGKVAVVTGGARGIGRGICRRFAREGARVLVADIAEDEGKQVAADLAGLGGQGVFLRTDVGRKDEVERMVSTAQETWGRVDVLVNDAIGLAPHVHLEDKTDEMFRFSFDVGFYATLWAMQAALPLMRDQGGGRVVNFYSGDADNGQWFHADYNATKAAIRALTVSGAAEWGRYNVLCNAISPAAAGTVYYELVAKVPELAEMASRHPLGRPGDPETDIAPVALFLATEDSQYVNGQTITVDGGGRLSAGGVYPADPPDVAQGWLERRAAR
ncbi:MAG TPA: SDR family oxidoreductase [Acidimicrobiales bacterium]|nr:SDR family oxidoreductase [Acidimicrobiales bacterium]